MRYELVLPVGLDLRKADQNDDEFMEKLFASTREYLYQMNVPAQYVEVIVKQQYLLQKNSYEQQWPDADTFIIRWCGQAIGKIIINEEKNLLHLIDCAFVPEKRGKGYGTIILRTAQSLAKTHLLSLKLSVERHNLRAKKLYQSVGFGVIAETASHEIMTWKPAGIADTEVAAESAEKST